MRTAEWTVWTYVIVRKPCRKRLAAGERIMQQDLLNGRGPPLLIEKWVGRRHDTI